MSSGEVDGATLEELAQKKADYYNSDFYQKHGIPWEVSHCISEIRRQPEDYDGPQRYCTRWAEKYDGYDHEYVPEAYASTCRPHGGKNQQGHPETLEDQRVAAITHGAYAQDEHLKMDFDESEQKVYDSIMSWADVYGWPDESEDPARYEILDMVATNAVRRRRCEDYLDEEGEVHMANVYDDDGVVIDEEPQENPLSREYRLMLSEIVDELKELGLTPKERQKMDKMEAEESQADKMAQIANKALDSDKEYDPEEFT